MSRVAKRSALSPAEYLAWERAQPERHEYDRGEVFAMAGRSLRHNALCSNIIAALHGALRARGCTVFSADQRIGVGRGERYVYPDVSVVCGAVVLEAGTRDVIANPVLLVEVLSESTELYDRGIKWEGYQRIESLADYVLVSQAEHRVEHFRRDGEGTWLYRAVSAGGRLTLTGGVEIAADAVFDGVFALPGD